MALETLVVGRGDENTAFNDSDPCPVMGGRLLRQEEDGRFPPAGGHPGVLLFCFQLFAVTQNIAAYEIVSLWICHGHACDASHRGGADLLGG